MSRLLKRNEDLTEGLQRVSKELLRDLLQAIGQERLTPAQVHDARKIIKNLLAMLRLTRGALSEETRRTRNEALRNLADPLSGPRDAAVTLAAFQNVYNENLNGTPHPKAEPSWATQCRCPGPYQEGMRWISHQAAASEHPSPGPGSSWQGAIESPKSSVQAF